MVGQGVPICELLGGRWPCECLSCISWSSSINYQSHRCIATYTRADLSVSG